MDNSGRSKPKAIRFVPTYDGSARFKKQKKQRTTAACRTCRTRKTRCDGARPVCSTCRENGHVCLGYAEPRTQTQAAGPGQTKRTEKDDSRRPIEGESQGLRQQFLPSRSPKRTFSEFYHDARADPTSSDLDDVAEESLGHQFDPDDIAYRESSNTFSVPYFRYFGPTAIVPGYKQMVVQVKEPRRTAENAVTTGTSPGSKAVPSPDVEAISQSISEIESALYDPSIKSPNHPLIEHLVETFFIHLGCNFPFLQRKTFLPKLRDKSVEVILVDAICAIAARFSKHHLLVSAYPPITDRSSDSSKHPESEYGQIFSRRAKLAIGDTFPYPTLASIQAFILLAHDSFGSGQDSSLWMYLGCAIRMAQDMGLQKLDGIKGPEPQSEIASKLDMSSTTQILTEHGRNSIEAESAEGEVEEERANTFWSVLLLDTIISSGTGRPVTLRDEEIELPLPTYTVVEPTLLSPTGDAMPGWPRPFPALVRMLHLYGRVSDLLNNIRGSKDVTPDIRQRLNALENDLTRIYQELDPRLTFNVVNFQHYIEVGEGSNFVMVHFWFHTLIILLHQPTLLNSYGDSIQELFPNSRELSMSSAKTIADILAFAELVDSKSTLSNPFTSQPIYVAASAFLKEIAAQTASQPATRPSSPSQGDDGNGNHKIGVAPHSGTAKNGRLERHSLLASAAKQNYEGCYKALHKLETYWAGIRYILTALNQKFDGIWDPETFTEEEMKHAVHQTSRPIRRTQQGQSQPGLMNERYLSKQSTSKPSSGDQNAVSKDLSRIWTLSGNTNSQNANLTFLYKSRVNTPQRQLDGKAKDDNELEANALDPSSSTKEDNGHLATIGQVQSGPGLVVSAQESQISLQEYNQSPHEKLMNIAEGHPSQSENPGLSDNERPHLAFETPGLETNFASQGYHNPNLSFYDFFPLDGNGTSEYLNTGLMGDMMIESQDIDMTPFGGEMFPLYLPQDVQGMFFDDDLHGAPPSEQ